MNIKEMLRNPSNHRILIILLVLTILFFIGLFIRTNPFLYYDSYSYANYVFGITPEIPINTPIIGEWIFNVLPESVRGIQIIMLGIMLASAYICSKIGELYEKDFGWLAGVFFFGALFTNTIFLKLETDLFAIPFLLSTWYLLKRYAMNPTNKLFNPYLLMSGVTLIISGLIWKASIYLIPLFLIVSRYNIYYIIATAGILFVWKDFVYGLAPILFTGMKNFIRENLIIIGIVNIGILFWGMLKANRIKELEVAFWVYLLIALLNLKLSFIFFWIVALNCAYSFNKQNYRVRYGTILSIVFIIIALGFSYINAIPTNDLNDMIGVYQNTEIEGYTKEVNWDYGYFYTYLTKQDTNHYGGYSRRILNFENKIALTYPGDEILQDYNCEFLEKKKEIAIVKCEDKKETITN